MPLVILAAAILACALILWGGPRLAGAALSALWPGDGRNAAADEAIASMIIFGLLLGAGLIGGRLSWLKSGRLGPHAGSRLVQGAMLGITGFLIAAALAAIAGVVRHSPNSVPAGLLASGTAVIALQATSEEVFFRGWLQPVLSRAWGFLGILITAVAFAALHLIAAAGAPVSVLNLFLGGLLFGLLADRYGGIASAIGAHFTWNWAEQLLLGLDPNPGLGSFGAVANLDLVGSRWWGGSAEGLNASIAMTFALAILLAPLLIVPARNRPPHEPNRPGRAAS
jgi:membrane protease YdiL (CAAX protease family)